MKIEICKIEAPWLKPGLGCYISVNNSLIDVVTPLNNLHEATYVDLPDSGTLRMVIRDMGKPDGNIASVCISLDSLPQSPEWLTLQPTSDTSPVGRILIALETQNDWSDELFQSLAEIHPEPTNEIVLASEILTTPDATPEFLKTSYFRLEESEKKFQEIVDILNGELESYKESLQTERESNKKLREFIQGSLQGQETMEKRAKERENSLLELLNDKESELTKALDSNRQLMVRIKALELENMEFKSKVLKEIEYKSLMAGEVETLKQVIKGFEENTQRLNTALIEVTYSHIEGIDRSLESSTHYSRRDDSKVSQDSEKLPNSEETLKTLQKFTPIGSKIEKIEDFFYKVNGSEVFLAYTKDGLFVKCGNSLYELAEFFKNRQKKLSQGSELVNLDLSDSKKSFPKSSPTKSILRPVNLLEKYKPVLKKACN